MPQHKTIRSKWHLFREAIESERIVVSTGEKFYMPYRFPWFKKNLTKFLSWQKTAPMAHYVLSDEVKPIVLADETLETIEILKKFDRYRLPAPMCMAEFDSDSGKDALRFFVLIFENTHRHHIINVKQVEEARYPFSVCVFGLIDFDNPYIKKTVRMRDEATGQEIRPRNPIYAVLFPIHADIENMFVDPKKAEILPNNPIAPDILEKGRVSGVAFSTFSTDWIASLLTPQYKHLARKDMHAEVLSSGSFGIRALTTLMQTRGMNCEKIEKSDVCKLNKKRLQNKKPAISEHTFVSLTQASKHSGSLKTETSGTGKKMCFHLRSAHSKRQHYGPGNSLTKDIFVEAYLVNYSEGDVVSPRVVNK